MKQTKKETRGGTRQGSGAKPKFGEPTTTVSFRCPISKVTELRAFANDYLTQFKIKQ